jgi:hypothetical protein
MTTKREMATEAKTRRDEMEWTDLRTPRPMASTIATRMWRTMRRRERMPTNAALMTAMMINAWTALKYKGKVVNPADRHVEYDEVVNPAESTKTVRRPSRE